MTGFTNCADSIMFELLSRGLFLFLPPMTLNSSSEYFSFERLRTSSRDAILGTILCIKYISFDWDRLADKITQRFPARHFFITHVLLITSTLDRPVRFASYICH